MLKSLFLRSRHAHACVWIGKLGRHYAREINKINYHWLVSEGARRVPGLPGSEPFLPRIPGKKVWNTRLPCLESGLFCLESGLFCPESRLFCREFRACCLEFRAVLSRIPSLLFRIPSLLFRILSCSADNPGCFVWIPGRLVRIPGRKVGCSKLVCLDFRQKRFTSGQSGHPKTPSGAAHVGNCSVKSNYYVVLFTPEQVMTGNYSKLL